MVVVTLLTVLRWTIHTYFGWGSVFVAAWIPAADVLYRACGSIWPLIIGHAVNDLLLFAADGWPTYAPVLGGVQDAAAVAGAGIVWLGLLRYIKNRHSVVSSAPAARG